MSKNGASSKAHIRSYCQIYPPSSEYPLVFREAENIFFIFLQKYLFFSIGNLKNVKRISPFFFGKLLGGV